MPYVRLYYHFVWKTKHRLPMIEARYRIGMYNAIEKKANHLGGMVYAVNGTTDHVHLVTSVPAKISLSFFIGQIKGYSSRYMSHQPGRQYDIFA